MTYSVKGTFSYQVFVLQKEGEPIKQAPLQREFEVVSDGRVWTMKIVLVGNTNFDSFIYSYDGTNFLSYSNPRVAGNKGRAMRSVSVEASPVPATITSAGGEYLWLAFASGHYFKGLTNNCALSFERLRSPYGFVQRRYEVPCLFELSSVPPYLPAAIEYVTTNQSVLIGDDGSLKVVPLPAAFGNNGYTSAEFKSVGFTNCQGLEIPTGFEYRKYILRPSAKTPDDAICTVIVRGEVTSVSVNQQEVDCALPSGMLMISDLRVPDRNVLYPIDDGVIPAIDSPAVKGARMQRSAADFKRPQN